MHRDAVIEKLTHEVAILKRHKYARRSEQLDAVQGKLLDELIDSDLASIEVELEQAMTEEQKAARPKQQPKRTPLPPELPRTLIHHEPENTQCQCGCQLKRIGEDVSEKLDYVPGEFTVERHIRGKWACDSCETLIQAPVPPQVIDKGIPTICRCTVRNACSAVPAWKSRAPPWPNGWVPVVCSCSRWWMR